jgi:hypothetical protein
VRGKEEEGAKLMKEGGNRREIAALLLVHNWRLVSGTQISICH